MLRAAHGYWWSCCRTRSDPRICDGRTLMDAVSVIRTKRDGGVLTDAQIDWMIDAYVHGAVAEEQMAALAMAILLRGMTPAETAHWTAAMLASGERLSL